MKKIVFVMTSLNTGGIATSLKNLLNELRSCPDYNIDLVLFHEEPHDRDMIPQNINIVKAGTMAEIIAISQKKTMEKSFILGLIRLCCGGICKIFGHGIVYWILFKFCLKMNDYDVAISCSQSAPFHRLYGGCNEYVLRNIQSKKKVAFIHCDYVTYGINDHYSHNVYKKFDSIATVSDSVRAVFIKEEPEFDMKTVTVKNCHDVNKIIQLADMDTVLYDKKTFNIITVARMGSEKGHMRVIRALRTMLENKIPFKWYLVGVSKDNAPNVFFSSIECAGLNDKIVFCGNQNNPYRFMKDADLLLVPSFHEAAPMVFEEACLLHLPILTTDTVSAIEMVKEPGIGYVCENSEKGIEDALLYLANNRQKLYEYRENTFNVVIDNSVSLSQFKQLLGDV